MRNYEAMFIFNPELVEEKLEKEIKSVEKTIKTRGKGEVKFDNLGKKTLAYPIKKFKEGVYINYRFTAQPSAIVKIKEALKHKENILRFIIFLRGKEK
ncbi:MAG TPA: 30S ribosomal protein S6 [candidate division WOR-3 bacterium]|uniref:Small ribosomal subunit protein bS6 n=1 Tax=candidate division WOR-3 bacterium TaxID=2052148 RepID=A0A9C9ELR0_UNCW3|nr:30S ribosomal protein S6 [candidate division WOR-3 bacterium]